MYSQCTGGCNVHRIETLRLETIVSPIFLHEQGEFDHLIQVDTLYIIGSSNIHTTTDWLNLC